MHADESVLTQYRSAGALYALIIVAGLTGELLLRAPLIGATSEALIDSTARIRASILADAVMITADVALAVLLFGLLASAGRVLATMAAAFRLIQAAILGAGLTTLASALVWIEAGNPEFARTALSLHATGYDLGLIFFGINSVLTGLLLIRHPEFPAWLGRLLTVAGGVYLLGSTLRIVAPDFAQAVQPAYLIAIVAETAFAATLLVRGRRGYPRVLASGWSGA